MVAEYLTDGIELGIDPTDPDTLEEVATLTGDQFHVGNTADGGQNALAKLYNASSGAIETGLAEQVHNSDAARRKRQEKMEEVARVRMMAGEYKNNTNYSARVNTLIRQVEDLHERLAEVVEQIENKNLEIQGLVTKIETAVEELPALEQRLESAIALENETAQALAAAGISPQVWNTVNQRLDQIVEDREPGTYYQAQTPLFQANDDGTFSILNENGEAICNISAEEHALWSDYTNSYMVRKEAYNDYRDAYTELQTDITQLRGLNAEQAQRLLEARDLHARAGDAASELNIAVPDLEGLAQIEATQAALQSQIARLDGRRSLGGEAPAAAAEHAAAGLVAPDAMDARRDVTQFTNGGLPIQAPVLSGDENSPAIPIGGIDVSGGANADLDLSAVMPGIEAPADGMCTIDNPLGLDDLFASYDLDFGGETSVSLPESYDFGIGIGVLQPQYLGSESNPLFASSFADDFYGGDSFSSDLNFQLAGDFNLSSGYDDAPLIDTPEIDTPDAGYDYNNQNPLFAGPGTMMA